MNSRNDDISEIKNEASRGEKRAVVRGEKLDVKIFKRRNNVKCGPADQNIASIFL